MDRIDWGAIPTNKMGTVKRTFIVSYCHQWLPLTKKLHERNTIGSPLCPMCDAEHEDHQHFLTCSHYEGLTTRQVLGQIDSHTKAKGVDRILRLILQRGLKTALKGSNEIKMTDIPAGYRALTRDQERI